MKSLAEITKKSVKRLQKIVHTLSFQIVFIIIVLILPLNIYTFYSTGAYQNVIIDQTRTNMENLANLYVNELEDRVRSINNFIAEIEEADTDFSDISKAEEWDYYYISAMGLRNTLNKHMTLYGDGDAFFFYSSAAEHGMLVELSDTLNKEDMQSALFSSEDLIIGSRWKVLSVGNTKWLFHVNQRGGVYIGAGIQLDTIENNIEDNIENKSAQAVISMEKEISDSGEYISVTRKCTSQNLYFSLRVLRSEVIRNLPFLERIRSILTVATVLIIPILVILLRHLVLRPISKVNTALNQIKTDPEIRIKGHAPTSDFENVYQSFNTMAEEIVELKIDNYEQQLERQKVEFKNLQLQIKPHFLFNSLNLMYNLIQMKEYKSMQTMLLYLSDYFRYVGEDDAGYSRFWDEYRLIRKYLEVSEIRYEGVLEADFQIEDKVSDVMIPRLLIHNFVENVIKHGLVLTRKNHILLKAYIEGEYVFFQIRDDGAGMPRSQAERISQGVFEYEDGRKHVGLQNSYRRIKCYYGEKGSLMIRSEIGKGTLVTVKIPVKYGEKRRKEDETIDRK